MALGITKFLLAVHLFPCNTLFYVIAHTCNLPINQKQVHKMQLIPKRNPFVKNVNSANGT